MLVLVFAVIAIFTVLLAPATRGLAAGPGFVWLGTGGPAGTYFKVGAEICKTINQSSRIFKSKGITQKLLCTSAPSGGSAFNVRQLVIGAFTFALLQSDTQYYAHQGVKPDQVKPFKGLRSILSLYPEPFQLVVAKGSGIAKFKDIRGKRVNIGNIGSGTRDVMLDVMTAHGMSVADLAEATEFTGTEFPKALCDGRIDAYVAASSAPARQVSRAVDGCGAVVVSLDTAVEKEMVRKFPYYTFTTIPKWAYSTSQSDIKTIAVTATLVTTRHVDNEAVYEVVRTIMEHPALLQSMNAPRIFTDPQKMIRNGLSAPMHPGAVRYYLEKGLM